MKRKQELKTTKIYEITFFKLAVGVQTTFLKCRNKKEAEDYAKKTEQGYACETIGLKLSELPDRSLKKDEEIITLNKIF